MSFFKFNKGSSTTQQSAAGQAKKDPNAPQPTPLEKHIADLSGPVRTDGSDKFFGFENYGSTCYCNSIIQCLYYSAPFRRHVLNFPSQTFLDELHKQEPNGAPLSPRSTSTTPYPNVNSPARKPNAPISPGPGGYKPEEQKDSPEYRKKLALAAGPVLEMTDDNSNRFFMDESLFTSLREIFEAIISNESRIGVVSPHRFLDILKRDNEMFRSAMHQDAHEFLNLLLNSVVDNVEMFAKQHPALIAPQANGGTPEKDLGGGLKISTDGLRLPKMAMDTHWVHDLFEGILTSETRCLTCENTSQRDEAFLDLSVDLSPHTSVTSCLRKFSEEEMLCERNKFHCDNCGGLQEAEKRMKIKRLPRILALHLKRFKYTEDLQRLQKLFHRVQYPFHLRLFNTTDDAEDPDRLYELYAVVVHIGGGPYHGHYVSIIKTEDQGWLLFDDELVEPVDKSYVMNFFGGEPVPGLQDAKQLACAYVLFYQETTMEAMLKEQEMERKGPQIPSRVSDETAQDPTSPGAKSTNGIFQAASEKTPVISDFDQMDTLLSHNAPLPLLPNIAEAAQDLQSPPTEHSQPTSSTPVLAKTKKELKQEEKDRKAAKKAEEKAAEEKRKADEKAADERRKEASFKRIEAWRRADEEMKQALEMSKQTAATEARDRGESPPKESGFSRFRHTSMSLRRKPAIFTKDKDKEKDANRLPPMPQANGSTSTDTTTNQDTEEGSGHQEPTTALPLASPLAPVQAIVTEEKSKKHRFSLGRKRSTFI